MNIAVINVATWKLNCLLSLSMYDNEQLHFSTLQSLLGDGSTFARGEDFNFIFS